MSKVVSILAALALLATAAFAQTPAGTVITTQATATYTDVAGTENYTATSNTVSVTVTAPEPPSTQAGVPEIKPSPWSDTRAAGTVRYQPIWVRNNGTVADTFNLGVDYAMPGLIVTIIKDDNGNAVHEATETTVMNSIPNFAPGIRQWGFLKIEMPASMPAATGDIVVMVTSATDPTVQAATTLTLTVTNTVAKPNVELTLGIDKPTALPGETLTLTVTANNTGSAAATGVNIAVTVPAGFIYQTGTPAGTLTGTTLTVPIGDIAIGASKTATMQFKVE